MNGTKFLSNTINGWHCKMFSAQCRSGQGFLLFHSCSFTADVLASRKTWPCRQDPENPCNENQWMIGQIFLIAWNGHLLFSPCHCLVYVTQTPFHTARGFPSVYMWALFSSMGARLHFSACVSVVHHVWAFGSPHCGFLCFPAYLKAFSIIRLGAHDNLVTERL